MALRIKTSAGTIRDINTSERDEIRESLGITGGGASAPSAPTIGTLTAGDGTVSGAFTAGSNGGSAIIEHELLLSNGNSATGASSPISRAAPNGTAVTARVRSRNAVDWGPYSAVSNSVTPTSGVGAGPTFTPQAETVAAMNAVQVALGAPVPDRRLRTIDRMIERLKVSGAWDKLTALYVTGWETASGTTINLKSPGTHDLVLNGTATHTPLNGFVYPSASGANFHSTGILPASLSQNDVSMGVIAQNFVSGTGDSYVAGAVDPTTSDGLSIRYNAGSGGTSRAFVSAFGAEVQAPEAKSAEGMIAVNRKNGSELEVWHNSLKLGAVASTSVAPGGITAAITIGKVNGRSTNCRNRIRGAFVGRAMTDAQMKTLYAALWDCTDKMRQGEVLFYPKAQTPETVTDFDHIVYGTTLGAIAHAVQLYRRGESVGIVGGWRDGYHFGGMTLNGLGWIDWDNLGNLSGIARTWVRLAREKLGQPEIPVAGGGAPFTVVPRVFQEIIRAQLDSSKGGCDIPIFLSGGVSSVTKTGKRLTSLTTRDGRTFTGKYFHDASYEFDLGAAAGIQYATGREAAGTGRDSVNGFKPNNIASKVNPYVTEGVPASGLLPNVFPITKAEGDADEGTQSYNFRMTWTTAANRRLPLVTEQPPGYDALRYELLARSFATATSPLTSLGDFLKLDPLAGTDVLDVNNNGFFSTDWVGGDKAGDYVRATTPEQRETVWQSHRNYQLGLLYWVLNSGDPRIPAAVVTALQGYGWEPLHYLDPKDISELHFMQQMYIREMRRARRADGYVYTANSANATDGTAPAKPKTIAENSYSTDSHGVRHLALTTDPDPAKHEVMGEGGFFELSGGNNKLSPMPLEIATDSGTVENLSWSYAFVALHSAIGALRMEMPMVGVGQGTADIAWLARTGGNLALEDVDYTAYRAAAQAATWDAVPPRLPLVN